MKKFLSVLMAVVALGCLAGCVDHNDKVCDECGVKDGITSPVTRNEEGDKELCAACWLKEIASAAQEELNSNK